MLTFAASSAVRRAMGGPANVLIARRGIWVGNFKATKDLMSMSTRRGNEQGLAGTRMAMARGQAARQMSDDPQPQLVKGTKAEVAMESVKTGVVAGVFGSMVGVGGGVIMVPMMTCEPMCMQARHASATSLVAVLGTGFVSAVLYGMQGQVDLVGAAVIASASVLTAPAGAKMTMRIDNKRLKMLMGAFLMLVAPAVPLRDALLFKEAKADDVKTAKEEEEPGAEEQKQGVAQGMWKRIEESPGYMQLPDSERLQYVGGLFATGGLAGFLSGLLGIGGGMIVTPVLALTSGMPQAAVVGTSMVAMVFPSARGLYTHHTLGNVRWGVGRLLLVGSATGAVAGVALANAAGDSGMKYIFAAGMFFLGSKTFRASMKK